MIYSTRKAFLERAVVELVYKFDAKSYRKDGLIAKVHFFWSTNICDPFWENVPKRVEFFSSDLPIKA